MEPKNGPIVKAEGLSRRYSVGAARADFFALREVSLTLGGGQMIALVGPSGSGKSTLLHLIAGIDRPTSGRLTVAGTDVVPLSEDELALHRGQQVGVVFQFFQLLPTLTALENVMLPLELIGCFPPSSHKSRALALLDQVGVVDQANKLPLTLSGGQQQRVAIARALANDPQLLVADEPTGNLDSETADHVLEVLASLPKMGKTVLMATHERGLLERFDRVIALENGEVLSDEKVPTSEPRSSEVASCFA